MLGAHQRCALQLGVLQLCALQIGVLQLVTIQLGILVGEVLGVVDHLLNVLGCPPPAWRGWWRGARWYY